MRRKEERAGWLFVSVPVLQLVLFLVIPMLISLFMSFTDWNVLRSARFVGLENFRSAFEDEFFVKAVFNTFYLMLGIPVGMFLSLVLAVVMNRSMPGVKLFRVIFYVPGVCSGVAIAILWQWIYNKDYGIINNLLWQLFHIQGPGWLSDPMWVKPAMIIIGIWAGLGGSMLLFLAALQNISREYYEAAEIDGAGGLARFFRITLPMVTPVIFYMTIMGIIGGLQSFGLTYIMIPDGGPGYSSGTIVFYLWQQGFGQYKMGFASAVAWMLGIFIMGVTFVQFRLQDRWVYSAE